MRRRDASALLVVAALVSGLAWTGDSRAQAKIPRVGVLTFFVHSDDPTLNQWFEPFRHALADRGWIEGRNISFEYRSASQDLSQLGEAAAELVRLNVDVIWASGAPFVRAAHAATRTIPIVAVDFTTDPVTEGYVQSYGQPGGNITGVFLDAPEFAGKWFQLLKALVPNLSRVAVLWDPSPGTAHLQAVQKLARSFRVQLQIVEVRRPDEIDKAFSAFRGKPQALIILPSPMTYGESERLAKLAMKYRLPAMKRRALVSTDCARLKLPMPAAT
jgi:putative ABC transport system substrate-binding protein